MAVLPMGMLKSIGLLLLPLAFASMGCGDVKQQQPPRVPDETGSDGLGDGSDDDMAAPEPGTLAPNEDDGPKETEAEKRQKCCQQCVDGLPDDKSGDPPGAIPCTKLTTKMQAACVVYFDKNPTTGGEAQQCAAAAGEGEGEGPNDEGGVDLD